MGKLAITSFWILVAFFVSKVSTQQVGNDCSTADICIGALNEECDGSVCICSTGHEVDNGICQAVDCLALTAPTNGNNLIYSSGTVYESVAIYSCVTGYEITGVSQRTCQADASWSDTDPTCTKVDCGTVTVPTNGAINNQLTTYLEEVTFTCSSGYTLTSAATITCQASGAWSDPFATCSIVDCGTLTAPANGGISVPGTTFGQIVTFSCEDGYDLTGSTTTECLASGLWSNSNPTCIIKDCGQLTQPTSGTVNYLTAVTTFNAQAQFSCSTGYNLIGTALTVCESTGAWSSGTPTCSITDCGGLGILTNGDISLSSGTTYGSQASFTCDTGYTLNGDTVSSCQADGSWDNSVPTCDIKHCAALTDPVNGGTTYSAGTTAYGTVATFTCDTGYNLLGSATSTCGSDAAWTDNVPFCQIVDCGALTAPADGTLAYSAGTTYNSNAVFSCDLGHTMNGNNQVTCQEDGAWSGAEPFCNINVCGSLTEPTNGAIDSQTGTAYESTATFSCDTGYDMVGSASLTCQSDGSWSSAEPVCNIKDCGSVAAPTDGTISSTSGTTYLATIVFACNTGYNMFGGSTILCQADGTWSGSTPICLIKDCGTLSTPVNGYLNLTSGTTYGSVASFYCDTGYTRVGSSELNCIASGSWDPSSEPTCQIVDCGSLTTPTNGALTAPITTYQATASFVCDTGYTLTGSSSTDCQADGTWSNPEPTCVIKDCGALTAPTNGGMSNPGATTYLTSVTFTCDTGYDLVGSAAIVCQSDATWNDTEPICNIKDCGTLAPPSNGDVVTTGTTYGETGTFSCNTGYTIVGVTTRTCQADGSWSSSSPFCQIIDCGVLPQPSNGDLTTPGGTTFGGIAVYQCNLGYTLMGDNIRTCQADATWSTSAPVCQINDCGTLAAPSNGAVDLSSGTTYTEVATFSCNTGYNLVGDSTRTCQDNSDWSSTSPLCNIKDCGTLAAPTNGAVDLSGGTVYLSVADFTCDAGYTLIGDTNRTCQADGTWETPSPTCLIKDCGALTDPLDGMVDTSSGTVFQSIATYTCDPGYDLNGDTTRTCTSAGTWGSTAPTCSRKDCGTLSAPVNGTVDLSQGTLFEANATFNCDTGFDLSGTATRTCSTTGLWGSASPTCVIKDCGAPTVPLNGSVSTVDGTTYQEIATYSCDPGFTLTGTVTRTCQDDGTWDSTEPTCVIKDCGSLGNPADGSVTFDPNTLYQGTAQFSCDLGYTLNGSASRECVASGNWADESPVCDINDCGVLADPANGLVDMTDGSTYLSVVTFTCNTGYTLDGVTERTCQANSTWADTSPVCNINDCGSLSAPVNGTVDLSGGTVYQNVAVFSCDTGFDLIGDANRECLAPGTWETPSPYCQIKDCGTLANPEFGTVNISGATTYLSQVSYSCEDGFDLSGAAIRTCASDGNWTDSDPLCLRRDCGAITGPDFGSVNMSEGTLFEDIAVYSCNLGFNLTNGTDSRHCQADGTWNGSEPICVTKDCGALPDPTNGDVSTPGGTTFLQTAYYTCDTGYTLNGVSTRTCSDQGGIAVWSDLAPTCNINDCGLLADPNFGSVDTNNGTTYAAVAVYSCNTGYEVSGLVQRVCAASGTWSGDTPTCALKDCGTPVSITNGQVTYTGGTLYGATATYSCNTGYGLVGTAAVTCEDSGSWSTAPTCGSDCGTPPTVSQATVTYTDTLSGATATYSCNDGYTLSGNTIITCSTTGSWSNEPYCSIQLRAYNETCFLTSQCVTMSATCRDNGQGVDQCICALQNEIYDSSIDTCLKDCGLLGDPTNGQVSLPSVTAENQIATYTCDVGYALSGNGIRTCLSTGSWSNSAPTCITGCGSLDPPENGYVNTSAGMVSGNIAIYTCNTGYALVGVQERVCLEDSTWNGNAPTCNIECSTLADIDHGTVDLSLGHWDGSLATYICDTDYALVGTPTRLCQSTGLWTGVPPECIFAIFPEILLVFGSLFIFLLIVDVAILSFCLYMRYCKPKKKSDEKDTDSEMPDKRDEPEPYPSIFDEKPPVSVPPLISSTNNSTRKVRNSKIAPENTRYHPPPRKQPKIERPLYKYSVKPKTEIPEPGPNQKPNTHLEPLNMQNAKPSKDLTIENLNKDDGLNSDDSTQRRADFGPEDDNISLFDTPHQPWEGSGDATPHRKAPTMAEEVNEHGNIRARISMPPVPTPPLDESDEMRRYLRTTVDTYSKK